MPREKIGEVFHYYGKIGVAAIRLTDGDLAVGNEIAIQGPTTDFTQKVESLQIELETVERATKGQDVGLKVSDRCRQRDVVFRVEE